MLDKFESLDANEKGALESTLYRCRALAGRIGEELRKKKPEHFVDERSLEDLHASLEHAASVLEQTIHAPTSTAKGLQEPSASPLSSSRN
jgi:predicted  nucleic acid-binding Zn-ribbon protein